MDDVELDALLKRELAPPAGLAEPAFVARVDRAVAEAERYRQWRSRILRQLMTELAAAAAIGGSFAFVAQAPEVRDTLARAPGLAWPALLLLLLLWTLMRGRPGALA